MIQSAEAQVEHSLATYAQWEAQLKAFVWIDPDRARRSARSLDRRKGPAEMPLLGLPLGVKDIFDTDGIPTEYGSPVFRGRVPSRDATVVQRLINSGAVLFGKTVTAELAYYSPGETTNPWNRDRTPGGSSMGSAAAVAARVIPIAIGSQTNGSVIRPAAFCGVVGFKPTAGRMPTDGVLRFSESLDQLGVFALDVRQVALMASVMAGDSSQNWDPGDLAGRPPRLAIVRTSDWTLAEAAARAQFEKDVGAARDGGATIVDVEIPPELDGALPVHRTLMAAESHRSIGPMVAKYRGQVSQQLLALLDEGGRVSAREYEGAIDAQIHLKRLFADWMSDFDAMLTLPALGEAPELSSTGDPRCCTRWTLVGAPAITVPTASGPNHLPLGVQLVGSIDRDLELLRAARWYESVRPSLPAPRIAAA